MRPHDVPVHRALQPRAARLWRRRTIARRRVGRGRSHHRAQRGGPVDRARTAPRRPQRRGRFRGLVFADLPPPNAAPGPWRNWPGWRRRSFSSHLSRGKFVGHGAGAVQTYDVPPPAVVTNAGQPCAPLSPPVSPRRRVPPLRLHWFSQTIGPARGLELLAGAFRSCGIPCASPCAAPAVRKIARGSNAFPTPARVIRHDRAARAAMGLPHSVADARGRTRAGNHHDSEAAISASRINSFSTSPVARRDRDADPWPARGDGALS